jgi:ATP-binding cassette subfamily F protein 3
MILDEPTNHLDLETREALVASLADYSGAVVLVTHDWHLVELVADRLWLVADGTVRPFDGDLDDYRRLLLEPRGEGTRGAPGEGRRAQRRGAAERRLAVEPLRRQAHRAEEAVQLLAAERQALDRRLAAPEAYGGESAALIEGFRRRAELSRLIAEAEAEWLAAEEAIEASGN